MATWTSWVCACCWEQQHISENSWGRLEAGPAGPGLDLWLCQWLLCNWGEVLALSERVLPHLSMGVVVGPPLEVKGGFNDIMRVMWPGTEQD